MLALFARCISYSRPSKKANRSVRVLLTAFEPYGQWTSNSSWLTLVELLKEYPAGRSLVTRRYPVDLTALQSQLKKDLYREFDAVIHLGQSPGASSIKLEAIALNVAGCMEDRGDELGDIIPNAPVAYRSNLPLGRWTALLRDAGIPSNISYHAGTYLCNALMYLSHHQLKAEAHRNCLIGFIHLPLATEQVAQHSQSLPSMPISSMVRALRILLEDLEAQHNQQVA